MPVVLFLHVHSQKEEQHEREEIERSVDPVFIPLSAKVEQDSLKRLIKKGLVGYSVKKKNKIYHVTDPENLLNEIKENYGDERRTKVIKGKIDETRIWRRVLTSEEIKNIYQGNLIAVNKGCIADSTPTPDKPLQIISQVSKNVPNGESETSSVVIKASNSPVDTVCEICATPLGGGGCVDVRVIVK